MTVINLFLLLAMNENAKTNSIYVNKTIKKKNVIKLKKCKYTEKKKIRNELDIFYEEFAIFKLKNNIAIFRDIYVDEWQQVDRFISLYCCQIAQSKKMEKIIIEYGITKSYARLIDFYKNESYIQTFKDEKEILDKILTQGHTAIEMDIVFAIFRELANYTSTYWW